MKTAHKIGLARAAYRAIHFGRTIIGQSDRCVVTRAGLNYDLDLSQGIDFAIYLGIFERSTRKALRKLVEPSALVLDIGANIYVFRGRRAQLSTFYIRFSFCDDRLSLAPAVRPNAAGVTVPTRQGFDVHLHGRAA